MSRSDKLFSILFPRAASGFTTDLDAATLWNEQTDPTRYDGLWHAALCADVLLIRAASYRESFDLFARPKFWTDLYLFSQLTEGTNGMAKRGQRDQNDRATWKGFLDFRLTDEQLDACDDWKPKPTDVFLEVDKMLGTDFRLTLSYNKRTKLASCTIIDDDPSRKSAGYALSSSDENGAAALKLAVFKHTKILNGDWSSLLDTPPKSRRG